MRVIAPRGVADWPAERATTGVVICQREAGVAIVRVDGAFVGRVMRVGEAWQAWLHVEGGPLRFVGWARTRRDAVERIVRADVAAELVDTAGGDAWIHDEILREPRDRH